MSGPTARAPKSISQRTANLAKKKKSDDGKAGKKTAVAAPPPDPRAPIEPTAENLRATVQDLTAAVQRLTPPAQPAPLDLVQALVHIVIGDGLACSVGQEAVHRIEKSFVDRNEFRVTEAFEVAELLGDLDIPDVFDRCLMLRDAIAQIYNDQNAIQLDFLREAGVSDRQNFFNRVPALPPRVVRYMMNLLSFEEAVFADKPNQRVLQRLGLDPRAANVLEFFAAVKTVLAPFGHLPLEVGERGNAAALSPACLLSRLAPRGKR